MSVGDGCFSVEHVNGLDTNEYDAPSIPIIEVVNAPPLSVKTRLGAMYTCTTPHEEDCWLAYTWSFDEPRCGDILDTRC